jgi:hypothetical protein
MQQNESVAQARDRELRVEALRQAVVCRPAMPDMKAIAVCAQEFYEFLSNQPTKDK